MLDTSGLNSDLSAFSVKITPYMEKFIECLRIRIPHIIDGSTCEELKILQMLQVKEIGIVPITNNNQTLGIIAVDNIMSGRAIKTDDLFSVAVVANELGVALEHARLFHMYKIKACIDPLTKVFNRGTTEELLLKAFNKARRGDFNLSLGMADIDFFKKFNDDFGHLAGDSVLRLVAATMKKFSRPGDHVGRFGGEEFIFILNDTNFNSALFYGERLRRKVEKLGQLLSKRFTNHYLTISVGISSYESSVKNMDELIERADKALYKAKEEGRNRVKGSVPNQ